MRPAALNFLLFALNVVWCETAKRLLLGAKRTLRGIANVPRLSENALGYLIRAV